MLLGKANDTQHKCPSEQPIREQTDEVPKTECSPSKVLQNFKDLSSGVRGNM